MKKILLVILFALLLVGCEQDALKYFQDANLKTGEIERAKSTLNIKSSIDFSESIKKDEPSLVELLSENIYTSDKHFDKSTDEHIVRQYIGSDMMGFDTVFYNDKGLEYIKVPFAGKFIKLEELLSSDTFDTSVYDEPPITMATFEAIEKAWFDLVEEDDVVNLGNEVIDTPEGEVKVKKLVVTFSNEQVKTFLNTALDLVEADPLFETRMKEYPMFAFIDNKLVEVEIDEELDAKDIIESFKQLLIDIVVEEFKMVTYIDVDQYIIKSNYDIRLSFVGDIAEYIKTLKVDAEYQLYDLHQPISFEFPEITDQNVTDLQGVMDKLNFELPILE